MSKKYFPGLEDRIELCKASITLHRLPWWLSGKKSMCQRRRCKFDPWVRKNPWRRKWQPTPMFLSGKSHGQRDLTGCGLWGYKRVGHNLATKQQWQIPLNSWRCWILLQFAKMKGFQRSDVASLQNSQALEQWPRESAEHPNIMIIVQLTRWPAEAQK